MDKENNMQRSIRGISPILKSRNFYFHHCVLDFDANVQTKSKEKVVTPTHRDSKSNKGRLERRQNSIFKKLPKYIRNQKPFLFLQFLTFCKSYKTLATNSCVYVTKLGLLMATHVCVNAHQQMGCMPTVQKRNGAQVLASGEGADKCYFIKTDDV